MAKTRDDAAEWESNHGDDAAPGGAGADAGGDEGEGAHPMEDLGTGAAGIRLSGFKEFMLRAELEPAIRSAAFEYPSEVQHLCLPSAMSGRDVLCQAKSGMGKTAVFVLGILHQLDAPDSAPDGPLCVVVAPVKELAYQITKEFERFSSHMPWLRGHIATVIGGDKTAAEHRALFADTAGASFPYVVVCTPGRMAELIRPPRQGAAVPLAAVKYMVLDEADQLLGEDKMRRDVQAIVMAAPRAKQTMMFSATMPPGVREIARKLLHGQEEVFVDDEKKLTLHGLQQYYLKVEESAKIPTTIALLDKLVFNQVIIFVKTSARAETLADLLSKANFPSAAVCSSLDVPTRLALYAKIKSYEVRVVVATDLYARGIDVQNINVVINFDMSEQSDRRGSTVNPTDTYLHRVGRAGRFGTKGLAITYVATEGDADAVNLVQKRFNVRIKALPEEIDSSTYSLS